LIEFSIFSLVLALIIPIGFIFGWLEHKAPVMWFFVVLFIQTGGFLDHLADIMLLVKLFAMFLGIRDASEEDKDGAEKTLIILRFIFTFITVLPVFFILQLDTHQKEMLWQMYGGTKPPRTNTASTSNDKFVLLLVAILWKVAMACVRLYMVGLVIKSLIQHKKIEHNVAKKIQWSDCWLAVDLVCSGIPLGIITAIELFYFEIDHLQFDAAQNFELLKLSALAVDVVGFSYLIWFVIFGLSKRFFHHDDHHDDVHDVAVNSETTKLLQH